MANFRVIFSLSTILACIFTSFSASTSVANINSVEFRFSLLSVLAKNAEIVEFYEENEFKPVWVGSDRYARERRSYFFKELKNTSKHALPTLRYDADYLKNQFRKARTATELGSIEALITLKFLNYSSNLQTGILKPASVDKEIVRRVPYRSSAAYLKTLLKVKPQEFFNGLQPQSKQYKLLLLEKKRLEKIISQGGWYSELPTELLRPGDIGDSVVLLRNALIKRGYLKSNLSEVYDGKLRRAVQLFQLRHGLAPDGIAGPATFSEIGKGAEERLASVIVALERERWTNFDLGSRHVVVNLPDFSTKLYEDGALIF